MLKEIILRAEEFKKSVRELVIFRSFGVKTAMFLFEEDTIGEDFFSKFASNADVIPIAPNVLLVKLGKKDSALDQNPWEEAMAFGEGIMDKISESIMPEKAKGFYKMEITKAILGNFCFNIIAEWPLQITEEQAGKVKQVMANLVKENNLIPEEFNYSEQDFCFAFLQNPCSTIQEYEEKVREFMINSLQQEEVDYEFGFNPIGIVIMGGVSSDTPSKKFH